MIDTKIFLPGEAQRLAQQKEDLKQLQHMQQQGTVPMIPANKLKKSYGIPQVDEFVKDYEIPEIEQHMYHILLVKKHYQEQENDFVYEHFVHQCSKREFPVFIKDPIIASSKTYDKVEIIHDPTFKPKPEPKTQAK